MAQRLASLVELVAQDLNGDPSLLTAATQGQAPEVGGDDDSGYDSISVDKSNRSDVRLDQPLLKATDWFLTEQEITASRGGIPRSDISTYTRGNSVVTFTVTKEYFDSAYNECPLDSDREAERQYQRIATLDSSE
ncbi:hypothetical protein PF008_g25358 [Phytophthora fragariae]|uniref:Uncharacterized protein n=1 Tax=Phytophthora fragariae TaxID=53985 RepID=A0A6G0QL45_9STRA|nr:hypothetical protein PF008_g25358 [Phytophthora fragariae]